jgi:hypothetical protein
MCLILSTSREAGRPSGDGRDNAHEQPDSESEKQREHAASITCGCGNFGDAKYASGKHIAGELGVALAKPRNTPRPACGERVGARGLCDYLSTGRCGRSLFT